MCLPSRDSHVRAGGGIRDGSRGGLTATTGSGSGGSRVGEEVEEAAGGTVGREQAPLRAAPGAAPRDEGEPCAGC